MSLTSGVLFKTKSFDNTLSFLAQNDGRDKWQVLELSKVKVNTDVASFDSPARYSYALVVCDHSGRLVETVSRCCQSSLIPEFAEVIEIREALNRVKEHKQKDVVEIDCLILV